jgi:hypothetical protein|tara:strand:- start:802 stop:1200 length:399 start_codon:yes stop_codon:yes gene_type:complete
MKKIKKISPNNIKNIVREHFLEDSLLPEHKIDSIIKEYLSERDNFLDNEEFLDDEYEFSPKTNEALSDMVDGLNEMVEDLDIIKEKEGDVLVLEDTYADEYLGGLIMELKNVIKDIKLLTELKDNEDYEIND